MRQASEKTCLLLSEKMDSEHVHACARNDGAKRPARPRGLFPDVEMGLMQHIGRIARYASRRIPPGFPLVWAACVN